MPILISTDPTLQPVTELAASRGVLPTALGSAEIARDFDALTLQESVFSARVTSAQHLQTLRKIVDMIVSGDMSIAEGRLILLQSLTALGYTPETGFPDGVEVPPAVEGLLTDLRSPVRRDLQVKTQVQLQQNRAMEQKQFENFDAYPAWELVRIGSRLEERNWKQRWVQAGGKLYNGRMVALKGDDFWRELGSKSNFDDALETSHPPFAYSSGMGWQQVDRAETIELGVETPDGEPIAEVLKNYQPPSSSTEGLDNDFVAQIKADLKAKVNREGRLEMDDILARALQDAGGGN